MQHNATVFLLLLVSFAKLSAQKADSIQMIQGVEIQETRIQSFSAGVKLEKFDSLMLQSSQASSVATFLSEKTAVFLRSYSAGGIATLSIRGTNSAQSAVLWNGINICQPNMGMTDLSRISIFEFNDISIQNGGNSALLGSGALGGGLVLGNTLQYTIPTKVSLLLNAGSISSIGSGVRLQLGKQNYAYSGSFSGNFNKNDFKYTDLYNKEVSLNHARVYSLSSVHQLEYKLTEKQRLSLGMWYQTTDRQLPPTITMNSSDQQQWDEVLRSSLQWYYAGTKHYHSLRVAYINEKEHFVSPSAQIDSWYLLNTFIGEFDNKFQLNSHFSLGYGANYQIIRADIVSYSDLKFQNGAAIWSSIAYNRNPEGFKSVLNLRQDFSQGYKVPFCPSLSGEVPYSENISGSFALSKNYRVPTLNDKYWIPGGNPELLPESSWNKEVGINWKFLNTSHFFAKFSLNLYHMSIHNLIQWVPGDHNIWSPQNVSQVSSHGFEFNLKSDWRSNDWMAHANLAYNYSPSTLSKVSAGDELNLNKQMIYIPLHKAVGSIKIAKKDTYISSSTRYTGIRYVNSRNTQMLPGYVVCDIVAGKSFHVNKIRIKVQLEALNIFDIEYQSIMYYPEPGRHYNLNIILTN